MKQDLASAVMLVTGWAVNFVSVRKNGSWKSEMCGENVCYYSITNFVLCVTADWTV